MQIESRLHFDNCFLVPKGLRQSVINTEARKHSISRSSLDSRNVWLDWVTNLIKSKVSTIIHDIFRGDQPLYTLDLDTEKWPGRYKWDRLSTYKDRLRLAIVQNWGLEVTFVPASLAWTHCTRPSNTQPMSNQQIYISCLEHDRFDKDIFVLILSCQCN